MITMMVGVPGSGKSTWAKENRKDCSIVSTDDIREVLFGDASIQKDRNKVFQIAFDTVAMLVATGQNVVFDATNITKRDRAEALAKFPKGEEVEAVYLRTPLNVALERNAKRDRQVPVMVIRRMFARLQEPTIEEGFSAVSQIIDK